MKSMAIEQISNVIDGRITAGKEAGWVTGVSIDSRTIQPGDLFIAIRGENFDGHDFVTVAVEKGAVAVIVERSVSLPGGQAAVIVVDNAVAALGKLGAWYRLQLGAKVIAITGSAGKTTARQILHQVLSRFYRCRQSQKSFNNNIGVPLTILSAEPEDEILLLELGSNHPGEIAELTELSKPDAAVVTFIGPAHLEGFGTLENVVKEKASIAQGIRPGGTLYINGDQPALVDAAKRVFDGKIVTVGTMENCDVIGTNVQAGGDKGSLVIEGQRVDVPLAGKASLTNVLTVWSICKDFKVSLSDFVQVIGQLKPVSMRLEVLEIGSLKILNDCYNANPASMANALECLKTFSDPGKRRLVFVAGSMGELGEQSAALHTEVGRKAAAEGVGLVLCAGPFAQDLARGAVQYHPAPAVQVYENTEQLCNNLHKTILADDIVLVKGSRSAGLEKAVRRLQQLF